MPTTTPDIKVTAVRGYGARVVLQGENFDAARDHSLLLAKKEKLAYIHPFDDPDVIAVFHRYVKRIHGEVGNL